MRSAHDQMRAEKIRATHRRNRQVCAGCGQSWPCTLIAWADDAPLDARTLRLRKLRAVAMFALLPLILIGVAYAPTWLLVVLFLAVPVAGLVTLIVASRRTP